MRGDLQNLESGYVLAGTPADLLLVPGISRILDIASHGAKLADY
jgi:hypothetical protein